MNAEAAGFWIMFGSLTGVLAIVVLGLLIWINTRNGR